MIADKFGEFGPGDSATWPIGVGPRDPRYDEPTSEVDEAQDLMAEMRREIDRAEAAVFRRDWQTYRISILNVHDIARSLYEH